MRGYALLAAGGVIGALAGSPRPVGTRIVAGALVGAVVLCWLSAPRRRWGQWLQVAVECAAIAVACLAVDTPPTASGLMFAVCVLQCLTSGRRTALLRAGVVLVTYCAAAAAAVLATGGSPGNVGVALSPVSGLVATCVGMQWMVRALAGQAVARAAVQASAAELSAVLDTTPTALLVLDRAGRLLRCNRAAEQLFGLPPSSPDRAPAGAGLPAVPGGETGQREQARLLWARAAAGEQLTDEPLSWTRPDESVLALTISTASLSLPEPPPPPLPGPGHGSPRPVAAGAGPRTGVLVAVGDVTARHALEVQLRRQALTDELTGLPNRTLFTDRLEHALAARAADRGTTAVLVIDLDGFKAVNDTGGHRAGDVLLRETAARMSAALRRGDTVARLGGDEFGVLLEATTAEGAHAAAAALLGAIRTSVIMPDGTQMAVSSSIGLVVLVADRAGDARPDAEQLLADADLAMYAAKRGGGDRIAAYDPAMRTAITDRLTRESELRAALSPERIDEQILVHYQPYVDLTADPTEDAPGGRVVGVEALVRWAHPTRGLLAPGEFIGLAEDTGLIVPLGRHVLACAAAQAHAWQRQAAHDDPQAPLLTVSVNLSVRQLADPDLVTTVASVLAETGLPARSLTLELTESILATDDTHTLQVLHRLKELGLRLAIDDFGTGYSALSYLQRFPLDVLKVDRSFIRDLPHPDAAPLAASIIGLADSLGLTTIAEGIETAAQATTLRQLGCTTAQGFHFARPMPASELGALLRTPHHPAVPAEGIALP